MYRELSDIWTMRGITPIIAHVDRYISPFRTYHITERLAQLPVLVQANAEFFLHRSTARWALRLLRADKIQLLGSDSHNLTSRPPNLGDALQVINTRLGMDAIGQIQSYQRQVLQCD
jgi:protein-tyrosine phosphatase